MLATGSGALKAPVHAWDLYSHHSSSWGQPTRNGTQSCPSAENSIKDYWAWSHPSEGNSVSPSVSLSHQEPSISHLSFPIEGRQNENHNHRKVTKLITWATALSNLMKLEAMPCRATQDRWVMAEGEVKSLSRVWLFAAPWTIAYRSLQEN